MKSLTDNKFFINRKKILYEQRYTMSRLARDIGFTPAAVGKAILGTTQSLKLHRIIATKLDVSLQDFWPEFYGPVEKSISHDSKINEVIETRNYNEEANL